MKHYWEMTKEQFLEFQEQIKEFFRDIEEANKLIVDPEDFEEPLSGFHYDDKHYDSDGKTISFIFEEHGYTESQTYYVVDDVYKDPKYLKNVIENHRKSEEKRRKELENLENELKILKNHREIIENRLKSIKTELAEQRVIQTDRQSKFKNFLKIVEQFNIKVDNLDIIKKDILLECNNFEQWSESIHKELYGFKEEAKGLDGKIFFIECEIRRLNETN